MAGLGLADDVQLLVADRHPEAGEVQVRRPRDLGQPEAADVELARALRIGDQDGTVVQPAGDAQRGLPSGHGATVSPPARGVVGDGSSGARSATHRASYSKCSRRAAELEGIREFLFVALPLAIRGATGSMIDPVAVT